MSPRPRIIFIGTPQFAVSSLEACLSVGEVVAVVTQPDKPKGRGQELAQSPVKVRALERQLPVLQPAKLRNTAFPDELAAYRPEVIVVTAYGKILPRQLLELAPHGSVNVHASLLPRFRGAAPIQWAIAHGDAETGVCLMRMDEGLDTGPVISSDKIPIEPTDTSATLHDRLAVLGGALLERDLPRYLSGELRPVPQPAEGVVLAPIIDKEDGRIDFARPAVELERRLRAFTPWPGAFTTFAGGLLKITELQVAHGEGAPGTVLAASADGGVEVACKEGSVVFTGLQPEGKRAMSAAEFLNGRRVTVGSQPFGGAKR